MRVRCVRTYPSAEDLERLGPTFARSQQFVVEVGAEYVVYMLKYFEESAWGRGAVVLVQEDGDPIPGYVPLCMFELAGGAISPTWRVNVGPGDVCLGPPELVGEHFLEELADGDEQLWGAYRRAVMEMDEHSRHHD